MLWTTSLPKNFHTFLVSAVLFVVVLNGTGVSIVFAQEQPQEAPPSQESGTTETSSTPEETTDQQEAPADDTPTQTETSVTQEDTTGGITQESSPAETTPQDAQEGTQETDTSNISTDSSDGTPTQTDQIEQFPTEESSAQVPPEGVAEGLEGLQGVAESGTTALLITGDATALATIFNLVNTSFVNSEGAIIALSNISIPVDSVDVRPSFDATSIEQTACNIEDCTISIVNENEASVLNNVNIIAATGGNVAQAATDAIIHTGNAYAIASLFNLVNATFVGSNYMIISLNHIGAWSGDVVLPSENALDASATGTGGGVISNINEAIFDGTTSASADTGENIAEPGEEGAASIETGTAEAFASAFNLINTNIINTSFVYLLFNVTGSYTGDLFGLPSWLNVEQQENGFVLWGSPDPSIQQGWHALVENMNTATITNMVSSVATTGDNMALSENGNAQITTGDAFALASIANVANINVLGSNWLLGIFNIAGDWDGDVAFGRPDLWVGQRLEVSRTPARPFDQVTNYITIRNMGDSRATQTQLHVGPQGGWLQVGGASDGGIVTQGDVVWNIGALAPGQSMEVSYTGSVVASIPTGTSHVISEAEGTSLETDENDGDNHDSVSLEVYRSPPPRAVLTEEILIEEEELLPEESPRLIVEKTNNSTGPVVAGQEVTYTVRVINEGTTPAHNTMVYDVLFSETGVRVSEQTIDLGDVLPGEEIIIDYTVSFTNAMTGTFNNRATVVEETGLSTSSATSSVEVVEPEIQLDDPIIELTAEDSEPTGTVSNVTIERSTTDEEPEPENVPPFAPSSLQANLAGVLNATLGFWRWLLLASIILAIFLAPTIRRLNEDSP